MPTRPLVSLALLLFFTTAARALHFYLDANQKRCFIEELPTDTVVEGHYRALEWSEEKQGYQENQELGIIVEVTVCSYTFYLKFGSPVSIAKEMHSEEPLVRTRGPFDGRFTFTSHDSGDHTICLSTNYTSWFSSTHIRLYLDVAVGNSKPNTEQDRTHVSEIAGKVRDLNQKLEDIRREQQYQREREADYRDLSESTNTRAVWYSVAQIIVLLVTCTWQLRHLKRFFEDRKMR
ncbi:hypothetical protein HGRIS_004623 [Hohenbuehelia grisea]|uniref:GOLD domain-containing protein n=1 Tax=Hohenbuehelia grisea TaxID=104357 RepID=A0ABR3JCI7_9AGAR